MEQNFSDALQITVIGMGLVFFAILLLWGLIVLIVRLTAEASSAETDMASDPLANIALEEHRKKAAAVAAAVALAHSSGAEDTAFPQPRTALVSAWQAVRRANQLNQKGPRR